MALDIFLLATTAAFIGTVHTLIGPDHYVPFIVMSRTAKWSSPKTLGITILSGLGHVLGSVLLGFVGIALGIAVSHLEGVESTRGTIAAWGLIAFGLIYFVWGPTRRSMSTIITDWAIIMTMAITTFMITTLARGTSRHGYCSLSLSSGPASP